MDTKKCWKCNRELPKEDFATRSKRTGLLQSWCRSCRSMYDRVRHQTKDEKDRQRKKSEDTRRRNTKFLCDYLLEHPCVDCGETDPIVLEFDHVHGSKEFNLSESGYLSLKKIKEEMAKCVVRCTKCHRRRTALSSNTLRVEYLRSIGRLVDSPSPVPAPTSEDDCCHG